MTEGKLVTYTHHEKLSVSWDEFRNFRHNEKTDALI